MEQLEFNWQGFVTVEKEIVEDLKAIYSTVLDKNTTDKEKQWIKSELERIISTDWIIHSKDCKCSIVF